MCNVILWTKPDSMVPLARNTSGGVGWGGGWVGVGEGGFGWVGGEGREGIIRQLSSAWVLDHTISSTCPSMRTEGKRKG